MSETIDLVLLPPTVIGIYEDANGTGEYMPKRLRRLAPEPAAAFMDIASTVVVSDMYRAPADSLVAVQTRRGALRPGASAHNYGEAIDVDLWGDKKKGRAGTLERRGLPLTDEGKREFDQWMARHDWVCCRLDHDLGGHEAWHYNYFPDFDWARGGQTSYDDMERRLVARWSAAWGRLADTKHEQAALAASGFYRGEIDGKAGPLTRLARDQFCGAWRIADGARGTWYRRTLWIVATTPTERRWS